MTDTAIERSATGQFLPGSRANPDGRPKGRRNRITELREAMEIAVREGLNPEDVKAVMDEMIKLAKDGSTKAAKLVLDKAVPNASDPKEDGVPDLPQYVFIIQNMAQPNSPKETPVATAIDVEFTEVTGTALTADNTPNTANISQLELFPL